MPQSQSRSARQPIPATDMTMINQTLDAWCAHQKVPRRDAEPQAKMLVELYYRGNRSQIAFVDALVEGKATRN